MAAPAFDRYRGRELRPEPGCVTDDDIRAFIRRHAGTIYHPVGTCKMVATRWPSSTLSFAFMVCSLCAWSMRRSCRCSPRQHQCAHRDDRREGQ